MLTVLGGLAKFERELIRARTGEGRKRAKAAREAIERRDAGEACPHMTITRLTAAPDRRSPPQRPATLDRRALMRTFQRPQGRRGCQILRERVAAACRDNRVPRSKQ
jgi:DNA invertase Pin-like site-specific DNA recombinase